MAGREPSIRCIREGNGNPDAIVFVHGFTGDGLRTWADLSDQIARHPALVPWDCWTLTYASRWLPDITGIWAADADLSIIARHLRSHVNLGALARYRSLVLIAHSMGGLVVQKALTDDNALADRTSAVILFGTPGGGLVKARSIFFWKRQLADMAKSGPFITGLRRAWQERFGREAPFTFLAVAGERDQFVPPEFLDQAISRRAAGGCFRQPCQHARAGPQRHRGPGVDRGTDRGGQSGKRAWRSARTVD